jgi:Aspartyl protease
MPRPSWWVRRAACGAATIPLIAFAAPRAQAPADTQSLAPSNQLVVPFEHNARQNALMIRATINNRPALLLLDTGARNSIISREIAGMTGEDLRGGFSSGGPGFKGEAITMKTTVRIGEEQWHDHPVAVMNLAEVRRVFDGPIDGLLGEDLLCTFKQVTFDYPNKRIVFTRRDRKPI